MPATPLADAQVLRVPLAPGSRTPNHPRWPLLLYRGAVRGIDADAVESLLNANGWRGSWRNGIYPYDHFHSNASETLAIVEGRVTVRFGGPEGEVHELEAGDVAVLPPGTGHQRLSGEDFLVIGAYPEGQTKRDLLPVAELDETALAAARERIAAVARPTSDPVWGGEGVLPEAWE